jgi:predicted aconitase with swiveling domain
VGVTLLRGVLLCPGSAAGAIAAADEPLSFWGGLDPHTGEIIDRRHPLSGRIVTGEILAIPAGRGSCSASGVLLEAIANGVAPAGIVVATVDPIIGLGAILGDELLQRPLPVLWLDHADFARLRSGDHAVIDPAGNLHLEPAGA